MPPNHTASARADATPPRITPLDRASLARAQELVSREHYLHAPVDARCSVEGYQVAQHLPPASLFAGVMIVGRPQATACYPWYGSVADVATGRAEVTRWQVLNVARIYFLPWVQPGGEFHGPQFLPGFTDRHGVFRSTLASAALAQLADSVRVDYLVRRPPCFLDEPYELRWLLSYCDTRVHRGALYRAAGFELFRTNAAGIETWRLPLAPLSANEHARVREASRVSPRSNAYRAARAQTSLFTDVAHAA